MDGLLFFVSLNVLAVINSRSSIFVILKGEVQTICDYVEVGCKFSHDKFVRWSYSEVKREGFLYRALLVK